MTEIPPPVTALCGSSRFPDHIRAVGADLALQGHVVLGAWSFVLDLDPETAGRLAAAHRRMIHLADEVVIVAPGGYVGENTRREAEYARACGKLVRTVDPLLQVAEV